MDWQVLLLLVEGNTMAKDWAKKFYHSESWKKCRNSYIKKRISEDGGLCEECHEKLGYIVHHKIALTRDNISDPYITLDHNNLMYVCKRCHDAYEGHGVDNKGKELLCIFDERGVPVSLREIDYAPHSRGKI